MTIRWGRLTPKCLAARGFAPMIRSLRPHAVRVIRKWTTRIAPKATSRPLWILVPGIAGSILSKSITLVCGMVTAGSWNGPLISRLARSTPMKDIISVVMISFVP